jgi:hypothetical protein
VLTLQYRKKSITAIVSLSETNVTTTDRVQLMLDIHAPPETEVLFPEVGYLIEPFTVSDSYAEPRQTLPSGKMLHRRIWMLMPALPGDVVFQPLEISAGTTTIKTEPLKLTVQSILPEDLEGFEIKDIAAPATLLPEQRRQQRLWLILAGSAATLLIAAGIGRLCKRTQRTIIVRPHETAFHALDMLTAQEIDPVQFVHELNRILRGYLNARLGIPALESTSSELAALVDHPDLIKFLRDCDNIKFAHSVPSGFTEHAESFVRAYIEDTMEEEPCD